ncbi:MAG: hypothetical protein ACK2VD_00475 [Anaerolineae bacterium]
MQQRRVLREAITAVERGDKVVARQLLGQVLRSDPGCAEAWFWMSRVVEDDRQREECLRRALSPTGADIADRSPTPPAVDMAQDFPPVHSVSSGLVDCGVLPGIATRNDSVAELRPLSNAERLAGQRNIMLMSAMTLSLLCGLSLLLFLAITAVPRAHERIRQRYQSTPYAATLWCPSCEQPGKEELVLWNRPSGTFRVRAGALSPGTRVSVVAEQWVTIEGRMYVKIEADQQGGWVEATYVRRFGWGQP